MQFAKLKEQNLKRKKDVERSLAEWYATLELKQAIELLDQLAPERPEKRTEMLRFEH